MQSDDQIRVSDYLKEISEGEVDGNPDPVGFLINNHADLLDYKIKNLNLEAAQQEAAHTELVRIVRDMKDVRGTIDNPLGMV